MKHFALALSALICVFTLVACGLKTPPKPPEKPAQASPYK